MNENPNSTPTLEVLKGLRVQRAPGRLHMTCRWLNGRGGVAQILMEVVFFLIGLAFFIFPLLSLTSGLTQAKSMTLLQWATTLPFLLIGFFIIYRGLGILFNSSVFEVNAQEFKTWNGPLPFLGEKNLSLPRGEIIKVEWAQIGHSSRQGSAGGPRSGYSATYDVLIVTTRGKNEKLLSGLNDRDYAFAIQGEITRFFETWA
jgi:hypothetical protein